MTKKIGYIIEKIADEENLRLAGRKAQRGGKAKRSFQIRSYNRHEDERIVELRNMILTLDFPEHRSRPLVRKSDRGKIRKLDDEDFFPWKIMSHAIMQVIEPIVNKKMIADTSSCIKGRGCLYGVKRVKKIMRRYPDMTWFSQSDCKKYYQGISPEYMEKVLRHYFKDEKFIKLMNICVFDYYCGEEIEKSIEDERAKKERSANWRVHKRDDWEPRPQRDRPHPHRKIRSQDREELRRYGHVRTVEGGSEVPSERIRPNGGRAWHGSQVRQCNRTYTASNGWQKEKAQAAARAGQ